MNNKLTKIKNLGLEYLDYSYSLFGWDSSIIIDDPLEGYRLEQGQGIYNRLYFANNSDHRAVDFYGIEIAYHSKPRFTITEDSNLDEIYKKYVNILKEIKKFHSKEFENEQKRNKDELKKRLEEQLKKLN